MKRACLTVMLGLSLACAEPVTITDADGNKVTVQDSSRVVTLGGPITEIVYALGVGNRVIAADTSSTFPAAAQALPKVGYQRSLSAEGIIALKPTLVIGTTEAGPPSTLAQLRAAGLNVLILPAEYTPEGTRAKISALGKVFGREAKAAEINMGIDRDLAKAANLAARFKVRPKVMFIYARGPQLVQISGTGTAADAMISLGGGVNAVRGVQGYKPLTPEAAVTAAPDVILMLSGGLESLGGVDGVLKLPGLAQTPAGRNRRVVALDDLYLLGFGPRLGRAVQDLTLRLHPELAR
ncbi:hemin ABC transporter substrate-binding protein [Deinococcus sp. S9]|uniref:heme/hemin ABC transporter substrate-binding protein n=1 Tax=Deinococcus sp. S9 TaxID=2545754 RepID=UPI0010555947|nr:hemin ABC transporter substrate-binding protein [Deinococcus sp. S9]TDE86836.1 hemin ABC transporter substrate-binding protein [Deinococcus sp. S9]